MTKEIELSPKEALEEAVKEMILMHKGKLPKNSWREMMRVIKKEK